MGLFDFWKRRKDSVPRAGFFDTPSPLGRNRYLASLAGTKGLMALRVSGFDGSESNLVHGRFLGSRQSTGQVGFNEASAKTAREWLLMTQAMLKSAGTFDRINLQNGGTIVLSADVNVTAGAGLLGRAKAAIESFVQRYLTRGSKVEQTIETTEQRLRPADAPDGDRLIPAYSMGNLFQGRYYDKDPQTGQMRLFDEKSFAIEIRGVNTATLNEVANALRESFSQKSVLVMNDNDNDVYLIHGSEQAPLA